MWNENIQSIFFYGEPIQRVLFQCAFFWAERGENVWYISPNIINSLPTECPVIPDKNVLKLMSFIYIANTSDLLLKLCDIHKQCSNIPKVIIVSEVDHYWFLKGSPLSTAAQLSAHLLEALAFFVAKNNTAAVLIHGTSKNPVSRNSKLQTIIDLYFSGKIYDINESNFDISKIFCI